MTSPDSYDKPVPIPDDDSRPFFDGARRGQLMLQRCRSCGAWMWPVKPRCIACFAGTLEWAAASGRATLYTYTLIHQPFPGFADELPFNLAVVDLAEGVRMRVNIVGCPNEDIHIGMALQVTFDDITGEVTLPRFRPLG
jgi:uncharacterized protein